MIPATRHPFGAIQSMTCSSENQYDWNILRKVWHVSGCCVVVALFSLWKDVKGPVGGPDILLVLGWLAGAGAVAIDVVRFASPKNRAALEAHPVYGKMLRPLERQHFNASTYMVLAAVILVTLWRFGLCGGATLMVSMGVLGVADPAAGGVRYVAARWGRGGAKAYGVMAFVIAGTAVMWSLCRWQNVSLGVMHMAGIALAVGLLEAHTGWGVRLLSPLTERVRWSFSRRAAHWLRRFYPDDNLVIPLATAGLMEWMASPMM